MTPVGAGSAISAQNVIAGRDVIIASAVVMPVAETSGGEIDGEIEEIRQRILADDLQVARAFLTKLRGRKWDACSPRQKFQFFTLLADVEVREDHPVEAARLLISAREHAADDPVAYVNEVGAYELLGDPTRAHVLAREAFDKFPSSSGVAAACARTCLNDSELSAFLETLPAHLATNATLWGDVSPRLERVESLALGEALARKATTHAPDDIRSWLALAIFLFRAEIRKRDPELPPEEAGEPERARLAEADACLSKAIAVAKTIGKRFVALALIRRASVRGFSGDDAAAHADIDEAYKIAPNDPAVRIGYARSLDERGNAEASIRLLREAHANDPDDETAFLLGMGLCQRNEDNDRSEGADLLAACARRPGPHADAAFLYGIEALLDVKRESDALQLLDAAAHVDPVLIATMRARTAFVQGNIDLANAQATAATAVVSATTTRDTLRKLGKTLVTLARFDDSFEIWKRLAPIGGATEDIRWLVETAARTKRDAVVLDACAAARSRGDFDPQLLEWEARLLTQYDPNAAVDLLNMTLARKPDDKRSRLNLALLALYLPRSDIPQPKLEGLPDVADATAEEGAGVVHLLVEREEIEMARGYAYDLLRRYPRDVAAHRAFVGAMSPHASAKDEDPGRESVGPGVAVCWVEAGSDQERWTVIEDSAVVVPTPLAEEVSPDSALAKAFAGKRVGDAANITVGSVQNRTATIKTIISKYAYRVQNTLGEWQLRFPEHKEVSMFRAVGADGKLDIEPLIRVAQQNRKRTQWAEDLYRTQPLSVWLFARALGLEEIPAIIHLATAEDQIVRCCVGSAEEDGAATAAYGDATEIVVDCSALTTLLLLDRLDALDATDKAIVISYGTFHALQALLRDAKSRRQSESSFGLGPNGPGIFVTSTEARDAAVQSAQQLVKLASTKWRVEGSRSLASLDAVLRDQLYDGFGAAAVQSASIAGHSKRLLWTDDAAVAAMAGGHFAARRTWTQAILRRLVAAGSYSDDKYVEASVGLLAMRYHFTSVTPDILRRAARRAEWTPDRVPMKQVLDYLTSPNTRLEDACGLACALIAFGYRDNTVPTKRQQTLIVIAEAVARRGDAARALYLIQLALPRSFGLDVLGQSDAVGAFAAWWSLHTRVR